jgi:hypothetical protein
MNKTTQSEQDLPDSGQLTRAQILRGTVIALLAATAVTVVFILPAEYGVDPTGLGKWLGLTNLTAPAPPREAGPPRIVKGAFPEAPAEFDYYEPEVLTEPFSRIQGSEFRSDTMTIPLGSAEQVEIKLLIKQGDAFVYSWKVDKGLVYTDFHADADESDQYPDRYWIRYAEGELNGQSGSLVAPFDGNHGWYWLNIEAEPVTITLEVRGFYDSIEEIMRSYQ